MLSKMDDVKDFEFQLEQEIKSKSLKNESKIRTDTDGTIYEFDEIKKAWFPKIDEDFLASYQMNYGTTPKNSINNNNNDKDNNSFKDNSNPSFDPMKPPSDVNSNEYRIWYEEYCRYYGQSWSTVSVNTGERIEKAQPKVDFDWTKPPSDINSEEYRVWYEDYCKYYSYYQKYQYNQSVSNPTSGNVNTAGETFLQCNSTTSSTDPKNRGFKRGKKLPREEIQSRAMKRPAKPAWFDIDESKITSVYVTGLPSDITEEEFKELMTKVGILALCPIRNAPKIKLYKGDNGEIKGDGRCTYLKAESVKLALIILDEYEVRRGHKIKVERAVFKQKGDFDPKKKRKLIQSKEHKRKCQKAQEHLLSWVPLESSETRPRFERVCVIKNVFLPADIDDNPTLFNDVMLEMEERCKKFGEIKKVKIYDMHEEGVVTITFKTPEEADACVMALNGEPRGKRQLAACKWDGKTKYDILETEENYEKRLKKWYSFLEKGDGGGLKFMA